MTATADHPQPRLSSPAPPRRRERLRVAASGVAAAVLGVLPHVLHHAGPLAGAALLAGVGGSLLFGVIGLLAAIPLLLRLRRRFGGWRVPGAALALMVVAFSVSTFVIGPAITGDGDSGPSGGSQQPQKQKQSPHPSSSPSGHEGHH